MKHKHYDMIVAKAEDVDLSVFSRLRSDTQWFHGNARDLFSEDKEVEFFLCLPEHKDECLHWLGGGEIQDNYTDGWSDIKPHNGKINWGDPDNLFMNEEFDLRIKPERQKRWVAKCSDAMGETLYPRMFNSEDEAIEELPSDNWQFIEVEFEV